MSDPRIYAHFVECGRGLSRNYLAVVFSKKIGETKIYFKLITPKGDRRPVWAQFESDISPFDLSLALYEKVSAHETVLDDHDAFPQEMFRAYESLALAGVSPLKHQYSAYDDRYVYDDCSELENKVLSTLDTELFRLRDYLANEKRS